MFVRAKDVAFAVAEERAKDPLQEAVGGGVSEKNAPSSEDKRTGRGWMVVCVCARARAIHTQAPASPGGDSVEKGQGSGAAAPGGQ